MTLNGGGGGSTKCHRDFFGFLNPVSNAFWCKKFVWKLDKALEYTFCILHFTVQSLLGLEVTDYEKKNVTLGVGGQKSAKKASRIIWMAFYPQMTSSKFGLFLTPPPPIVTHFITKTKVLLSQNPWYPLSPYVVTLFMDDP